MYNILIEKADKITNLLVLQNGEPVEIYKEVDDEKRLEGNIYLGKVKNIVPGMQSAFIDIGENKNALIHIKDLLPKASNITGNLNEDTSKLNISKIIKSGEEIVVQVKKDCDRQKGARVTKDIKLNGKLVIFMPYSNFITVSQKIENEQEKNRLKEIVQEVLPKGYGIIVRTAAENKSKQDITNEIHNLISIWNEIKRKIDSLENKGASPIKLYDNSGIVGKIITDLAENNLEKIFTNVEELINEYSDLRNKIQIEKSPIKKFEEYNKIDLSRKIWLQCGGFITIDETEALTAIDVNSAKFTGKSDIEKTVLKVNMQAGKEIAKQIRLRDIGGIIIIDFIDMLEEDDRNKLREYMIECFKKDRSKVQVMEFTKLGLLEVTRKHIFGR